MTAQLTIGEALAQEGMARVTTASHPEERLARAVEQERVARLHLKRTGQHLNPAPERKEGAA